jgi:hypothetical protein
MYPITPEGQRRPLRTGKLPVGYPERTGEQPEEERSMNRETWLADAYDAAQASRGDGRRAFRRA